MNAPDLERLITDIYAAALDPAAWTGLVTPLAALVDAPSCVFQIRSAAFHEVVAFAATANYDAAAGRAYVDHYGRRDPWAAGWERKRLQGVFQGSDLTDERALGETEYYRDYARHHSTFHFVAASVAAGSGGGATAFFAMHRPIEAEPFGVPDLRRLRRLVPHLQRAIQVSTALASAGLVQRVILDALDRLPLGLVVVDGAGFVAFANRTAEDILRDDTALGMRAGRLRARDARLHTALAEMLRRAVQTARGKAADATAILKLPRPERSPLSVLVAPFLDTQARPAIAGAVAVVFIHDPNRDRPPPAPLFAALYHLSPAESRLLQALLTGARLAEYAERAAISPNTAATQLKSVFAKTDTSRQSELIALVLRDLAARLALLKT